MAVPSAKSFHWQPLASLPIGRVYCTPVESGGQLYLIGGCGEDGTPMSNCEVYSPEANQWTTLPPMPTPRAGVAVAALGKQILVIGGVGVHQNPLSTVEMYNVDEGKWEQRRGLCEAAMGVSVVIKDCRLYAVGGMGSDMCPQSNLQQYDMTKDVWLSLPAMPTPRYAVSTFLRGSKIHVFGGRQAKNPVTAFEVYDIEAKSWTRFPSIPGRRAFSSCVMTENNFFSLGGLKQTRGYKRPKFVKTVDVFDIEQGGWMKTGRRLNMKKKRADFAAAYLRGRVIVAGGLGDQPTILGSAEAFHPIKNRWERLPPMPTARCTCSSIVFKNRLLVIGGVSHGPSNAVEALYLAES
ncbi:kelch domain-containing protein 8A-like isoform X1 [Scyliorhinus canicula]|uniref:kelch domain-containing protein 8A-like isoform X1 n=1 Tax=Scyliorhinus canicula TaxID=7830 RepID=UPI0018F3006A|nr:kelch domain-containing protein 8A-like isoform X1 [Scyliorhinus canicula]XP_038676419.1 kelch domain-containing protein 8A-like isoform X1 [Scyliorhinus canicula]XP_038676420.1 kelch domain-containing protein 8A-like isoform X1 [Scyliorhinus canicula]XP_038676421.1 kelch domain-containing protein 8A-like isoform X1 [Scyliorhinus canicula]XP_038676422.1 kelch domain-containing protein 8A-like isoform X1 [Scyliorhinus canicula]